MPFVMVKNTNAPPADANVIQTVIKLKDDVNTALLKEHTRSADLANTLVDVEEQIREATESVLKSMRVDIEKKKRKIVASIKRLQDSAKRLSKSETKLKTNNGGKSADTKKAKRRVKDVQKVLAEVTAPETDNDVSNFFANQIVYLCQRLTQISGKISSTKTSTALSIDLKKGIKSDSESDDASSSSRATTPQHIYAEIRTPYLDDIYLAPNKQELTDVSILVNGNHAPSIATPSAITTGLGGVQIFSSDSDTPEDRSKGILRKSRSRSPKRKVLTLPRQRTGSLCPTNHKLPHFHSTNDLTVLDSRGRPRYRSSSQPLMQSRQPPTQPIFSSGRPTQQRKTTQWHGIGHNDREEAWRQDQMLETDRSSVPSARRHLDSRNHSLHTPQTKFDKSSRSINQTQIPNNQEFNNVTTRNIMVSQDPPTNNSLSPTKPLEFRQWSNASPMSARSAQKRVLPALPKSCDTQCTNKDEHVSRGFTHRHTIAPTVTVDRHLPTNDTKPPSKSEEMPRYRDNQRSFLAWLKSQEQRVNTARSESLDEDELQFQKTVNTAKADIMDKLKRIPYVNMPHETEVLKSDKVPSYKDFENRIEARSSPCTLKADNIYTNSTSELRWGGRPSTAPVSSSRTPHHQDQVKTQRVAPFIHLQNSNTVHSNAKPPDAQSVASSINDTDSIVTSNIKKFESEICKQSDRWSMQRKSRRAVSATGHTSDYRYRSASEPRTQTLPTSILPQRRRQETATLPRERPSRIDHRPDHRPRTSNSVQKQPSLESLTSSYHRRKSSTEIDLQCLVKTESASSIRQWSLRRSNSFRSKSIKQRSKNTPNYKYTYAITFSLPDRMKRCHISSMAVLDNEHVVVLDERNFYLHLFDQNFKHMYERKLYDIPRGCEYAGGNDVFVALPYKRTLHHYMVDNGSIGLVKEVTLSCNAWILDISFAHNYLNILCKGGHVHRMARDGTQVNHINIGMTGRLFFHPTRKRFYILGEGRLSKFNIDGTFITSHSDIDAHSILFLENHTYIADRQKHRLLPLTDVIDVQELTADKIEYPSATCASITGDKLFVSQYEDCLDDALTKSVRVYEAVKH